MPNSFTSFRLVETATMCLATAFSSLSSVVSQVRTVRALSIVSAVVKVLETTTTRVVSGSRSCSLLARSTGSTLAMKRSRRPRAASAASGSAVSAVCTKSGPRKEPPIPMATTSVRGFPVLPRRSPLRTLSLRALIRSSTSQTIGTTFTPWSSTTSSRDARSAVWSTARPSVAFIRSPRNIASTFSFTLTSSASWTRRDLVLKSIRCRA
mmetsp:Transcript_41488/g.98302  ORF Transcript_41488/g.98302 Transcript_41488/m.98302 type:complete len:209 (-) Transcript_41488:414-1040(-)